MHVGVLSIAVALAIVWAAPAAAQTPAPSAPSSLASLVEELDRNNPELKAARRDVDMRVTRVAPAGAPPDPMFSFGYMGGV